MRYGDYVMSKTMKQRADELGEVNRLLRIRNCDQRGSKMPLSAL